MERWVAFSGSDVLPHYALLVFPFNPVCLENTPSPHSQCALAGLARPSCSRAHLCFPGSSSLQVIPNTTHLIRKKHVEIARRLSSMFLNILITSVHFIIHKGVGELSTLRYHIEQENVQGTHTFKKNIF